jgi:formate--tetrahydrofolate ligase
VIVATVRALKFHGGVKLAALNTEDIEAVTRGIANLVRHIENLGKFGVPAIVAINNFASDTDAEIQTVVRACAAIGVKAVLCRHWAEGSAGAVDLARAVVDAAEARPMPFRLLYPDEMPLLSKIETIAREIYRADDVAPSALALDQLAQLQTMGFGGLPVCIAKTQYSNSSDPSLLGAPIGHTLHVREVRLSAGAEFVVAICGQIVTMPGLPRKPAAETIRLEPDGRIVGLS